MSKIEIFKSTIPVMFGYIALGLAVGIYAGKSGISPAWVALASLIVYAGSGQLLLTALIITKASLFDVFLISFLLNFRHFFYTLSLLNEIKALKFPYYFIFALTDETFALLKARANEPNIKEAFVLTAFLNQSYWFVATVAGAFLASELPFNYDGVEFSLVALFAVLGFEIFRAEQNYKLLFLGFCAAFLGLFIFPAKYYIFGAIMLALISLFVLKKRL